MGGTGRRGEGARIYRDGLGVARLAACQLRPSTVGRQAGLLARELAVASGTEREQVGRSRRWEQVRAISCGQRNPADWSSWRATTVSSNRCHRIRFGRVWN